MLISIVLIYTYILIYIYINRLFNSTLYTACDICTVPAEKIVSK